MVRHTVATKLLRISFPSPPRVDDHLQAVCIAVYAYSKRESSALPVEDRPTVERHLRFVENLHIGIKWLQGSESSAAKFSYDEGVHSSEHR